jgi:hypothetical protein
MSISIKLKAGHWWAREIGTNLTHQPSQMSLWHPDLMLNYGHQNI